MSDHSTAAEPTSEPTIHVDQWEGLWMRISIAVIAIFIVAIIVAAVAYNIQVPGVGGRIDPNALDAPGSPFATPGLRELAPGKYEVYIVAQAWAFNPGTITVPQGAEVTFYVTSRDIQHGFKVVDTNINLMILPGQIGTLKAVFDTPGTYNFICHEYCGIAHHTMFGQIIVEPPASAEEPAAEEPAAQEHMAEPAIPAGGAAITETATLTESEAVSETAPVSATEPLTETAPITESVETTATSN